MSTNFPTSLDVLTNPTSTDPVTSPSHSTQHANANDSIEALEAKVGVNSSEVTTTHDYKLSGVTGSDKAVSKTGVETLTNKTIASFYQDAGQTKLMTTPDTASDTLAAIAATQALTNKTLTSTTNNVAAKSLHSATTVVDVSAATAPTAGQVLKATSGTAATWQTLPTSTVVVKNGVTTYDLTTASGTQTIAHGLGATPTYVKLIAVCISADYGDGSFNSNGSYNGTTNACVWTNGASPSLVGNSATAAIALYRTATAYQTGVVTVDGTNITITWTKTSTPTGTAHILWEAM